MIDKSFFIVPGEGVIHVRLIGQVLGHVHNDYIEVTLTNYSRTGAQSFPPTRRVVSLKQISEGNWCFFDTDADRQEFIDYVYEQK